MLIFIAVFALLSYLALRTVCENQAVAEKNALARTQAVLEELKRIRKALEERR